MKLDKIKEIYTYNEYKVILRALIALKKHNKELLDICSKIKDEFYKRMTEEKEKELEIIKQLLEED